MSNAIDNLTIEGFKSIRKQAAQRGTQLIISTQSVPLLNEFEPEDSGLPLVSQSAARNNSGARYRD